MDSMPDKPSGARVPDWPEEGLAMLGKDDFLALAKATAEDIEEMEQCYDLWSGPARARVRGGRHLERTHGLG